MVRSVGITRGDPAYENPNQPHSVPEYGGELMSIIDELITDRTQADVNRVRELALKGWANLTDEEFWRID